jgi:hypothetical protein
MSVDLWRPPTTGNTEIELPRIERALMKASVGMRSPIIPQELVVPPEIVDS